MGMTSNSFLGIKKIDLSNDDNVIATTGTNTQILTPPVGQVYQVQHISYYAIDPAGSSSGFHELRIQLFGSSTERSRVIKIKSATGASLTIGYGQVFVADNIQVPTLAAEQMKILEHMWANNDLPINFTYLNTTDVAQAANRALEIIVKVYKDCL